MTRKFLIAGLILLVVAPTLACFCANVTAEPVMVCHVERAADPCCCETNVQSTSTVQLPEYVLGMTVEPPGLMVSTAPPFADANVFVTPATPFQQSIDEVTLPDPLYLTHQTFLI